MGGAQIFDQSLGVPCVALNMPAERLLCILARRDVNDRLAGPTGYDALRRVEHPFRGFTPRPERQGWYCEDQEQGCCSHIHDAPAY